MLFIFCFALIGCNNNENPVIEYKIEFIVDNQNYSTIKTKGNEVLTLPINPTKEDYNFDGWFFASAENRNYAETLSKTLNQLLNENINLQKENDNLKNEVRILKSNLEALKYTEKEVTNVDLIRRISRLEKIVFGESNV